MTATCAHQACGVEFEPKRPHQRFCCDACRLAAHERKVVAGELATVKAVKRRADGALTVTLRMAGDAKLLPGMSVLVHE